ncbi:hypothetical protein OHC33_003890 [Knufia fluminis]|uniref:Uncharacterized protein n=1 Tax=Knufia fluminis TaxID=191047 RepID=A0AAN8EJ86_9EURO|nr:hypothetical protein OHC33_003890 [Knufia fluminis]
MFVINASSLVTGQDCTANFKVCAPPDATSNSLGPIGSSWANLYMDIVKVVNDYDLDDDPPTTTTVDPNGPARREQAFCFPEYKIPMCWDKYTTNVYFPDGTFGNVNNASFNTSAGDTIDMVYGDYTLKDGTKGNIYDDNAMSSMKPDTSTLSLPSPWTSSGVGSAIPATGLGTTASLSIGTTILPATTEAPSTGGSITLIATMTGCGNCPPYNSTIPGPTQPGTTRLASTSVFTTGIITPTMVGSMAFRVKIDILKPIATLLLGFVVFRL